MKKPKVRRESVERSNVLWMIIFRLLVITLLLVLSIILEYSASFSFRFITFVNVILAAYALSAAYMGFYYWGKHLRFQVNLQLILDLLVITGLVYVSGGIAGSMYFLYIFPIFGAGLVLSSRASYIAASLSAILFGVLSDGMYLGFIPVPEETLLVDMALGSVLFTIFTAWGAFFVMAFLINVLAVRLRSAREDLRRAQKELLIRERLSEAGRISATLAHEIRNPLAAISGSVQVLRKNLELNLEQEELMDIILKESQRVSHNLEQFLDFALPPKQGFSVINLSDLLDETIKILQGSGELNGCIDVRGNYSSSRLHYFGSPGQFKQVFWNILKNSVRAMPGGGTLSIDFSAPRRGEIEMRFKDSGVGMTEEDKAHLFEPFYSGFDDGRGLGLPLVRRIVDDYDGVIEVRSEPQKGTEIVVTLPVREMPKR